MRIGILGGTFNPIHKGHIKLASGARRKLKLDKIIFVPANIPPHKIGLNILPAKERYKMVSLALKALPYFDVSDYEIMSKGTSYSIKTIKAFKRKFGKNAKLFFLTGSDSLSQLNMWKHLDKIINLSEFVTVNRPGHKVIDVEGITAINIPTLNISSSDIRGRVKKGLSVEKFLPKQVYEYIKKRGFYK